MDSLHLPQISPQPLHCKMICKKKTKEKEKKPGRFWEKKNMRKKTKERS